MYARRVYMHLKPNRVAEFTGKIEKDVIPTLRKQKGFQDEITFVAPSGTEAFAISLWDRAESAEAYNRASYSEVAKTLKVQCLRDHPRWKRSTLRTPHSIRSLLL